MRTELSRLDAFHFKFKSSSPLAVNVR